MLDHLGVKTKVEQSTQDGSVLLHIATAEPGRLIGRQGQALDQLQFLLNRILQRRDKNAPRVVVDCERYRQREHDELLKSALDAADRVRRWGEPVVIGPFNSQDRQTIHRYLERDPELEAISEGGDEAGQKKMQIRVRAKPVRPAAPAPPAAARPATP
jgi:spoIIIJ-associated protein